MPTSSTCTCAAAQAYYPAYIARLLPNCVVAVSSITQTDALVSYSNWGSDVLLAAPVRRPGAGWEWECRTCIRQCTFACANFII